jgi:4-hydroxybenzoate polyprenyltransferase
MTFWPKINTSLEMIKWEHSVFALPFALTGAVLAAGGWPRASQIFWIVSCMVLARSAGMAFNRWADANLDADNPRTKMRAIPAGLLSREFVGGFAVVTSVLFLLAASQLNRLTLLLAPAELAVLLAYSYTKRFTRWSHLVLGFALGIAPTAAWIAIRGSVDRRILVLTLVVLCWVGGFDILYACQDAEHDRRVGLKSIPASIGVPLAFVLARGLHVVMLALLMWLTWLFALGGIAWIGILIVAALLLYEHSIVSPNDLRRMNAAFFTMNGLISAVFFVFIAADILWRRWQVTDYQLVARILLSVICASQGLGTLIIDLNRTHATNPRWAQHARFHLVWQTITVFILSAIEVAIVWWPGPNMDQRFYLAIALTGVPMLGFLGAYIGRKVYDGALSDPNSIPPAHIRVFGRNVRVDLNLAVELVALLMLFVTFALYKH